MRLIQNLLALGSAASALAAPTTSMTKRQSTLEGQNLRILPLGDSITYGMGSTTGNAYRASLLDSLTTAGATIDYTGTIQSGSMDDNDNEGRIGWTIEQISGAATDASSAGVEADVVLLHAGTNDATTYGWEEAHVRLGELIETVTGLWPEAKVLVAKIVPSAAQDTQEHIEFFNERVQGVVDDQANDKLSVVDMGSALDPDTDLDDALHPNDQGYEKMAAVWFEGLSAVL